MRIQACKYLVVRCRAHTTHTLCWSRKIEQPRSSLSCTQQKERSQIKKGGKQRILAAEYHIKASLHHPHPHTHPRTRTCTHPHTHTHTHTQAHKSKAASRAPVQQAMNNCTKTSKQTNKQTYKPKTCGINLSPVGAMLQSLSWPALKTKHIGLHCS